MKVKSSDRSTGMGAIRYTAILDGSTWVRVRFLPGVRYLGRDRGVENWEVEVSDGTVTGHFYRSNSGKEAVTASNGMHWGSFSEAKGWASDQKRETVIITRHPGTVEWLTQRGITGPVISQANPEDVQGKHVVGNLPLHLACLARSVTIIDLPGIKPEQRGKDLTPAEMDTAGASLTTYRVVREEEYV